MRKLRARGAIKKKQNTHYYQLTEEGLVWIFYSIFSHYHFVTPLMSKSLKKALKQNVINPSKIEEAYTRINESVSLIISEFGVAA
jgi:predicted transcriptional regulator